ncbi:MAG: YqjK-like family protein [Sulfuricella sp.]|nr:YqjK-like family protein [Sulfuricella sp.]
MNARQVELIRRRERLLMRAEAQRHELGEALRAWRVPLRVIDGGVTVVRTLRTHPLLWIAPLALLIAARPRRVMRWSGKVWTLWRLWRSLRASPLAKWLLHAA